MLMLLVMPGGPIITFTSDFGNREYYVGAVKGSILSICPEAQVIDITHEVGSHDLLEGAFTLLCSYSYFPTKTIHLVVVDPGVGSNRRGIIASTETHYFVAPDNGVLSLVYNREPAVRVISIEAEHYFRRPVSPTFHGRDIFGAIAAWIARGIDIDHFGPEIKDYVRLGLPRLQKIADNRLEGIVLHIDKFGNIITSISPEEIRKICGEDRSPGRFLIDGQEISRHYRYYAEAAADEVFSLLGSSGYYEIAAQKRPAARLLNVKRGAKVQLEVA